MRCILLIKPSSHLVQGSATRHIHLIQICFRPDVMAFVVGSPYVNLAPSHPTSGQVAEFIETIQEHFLAMLMLLSPFLDLNNSSLTLKLDFGNIYRRTSKVEADSITLPGQMDRALMPPSFWISHQVRKNIGDFMIEAKNAFGRLTNDIQNCVATLTVEIDMPGAHQSTSIIRVTPRGITPHAPFSRQSPPVMAFDAIRRAHRDGVPDALTFIVDTEEETEEEPAILLAPIPLGFNYFDQFGQR